MDNEKDFFNRYRSRYSQYWVNRMGMIPNLPMSFDNSNDIYELLAWLQRANKVLMDDFLNLEFEFEQYKHLLLELLSDLIPQIMLDFSLSDEYKELITGVADNYMGELLLKVNEIHDNYVNKDEFRTLSDDFDSLLTDISNSLSYRDKLFPNIKSRLDYIQDTREVYVTDFGALGDGVNDDAPAFRKAIEHVAQTGGTVIVPLTENFWAMKSTNSDNCAFNLPDGVFLKTISNLKNTGKNAIKAMVNMLSVVRVQGSVRYGRVEQSYIDCNNLSDYGVSSSNQWIAYFDFNNTNVTHAKLDGFHIKCFMTRFRGCNTVKGKRGFYVFGQRESRVRATSVMVENCFAIESEDIGINLEFATYSNITASGGDRCETTYYLDECDTTTLSNVGVEGSNLPILLEKCDRVGIEYPSIYIGDRPKIESLIVLRDTKTVNIKGLKNIDANYDYKLKLEGNTSNIIIEDRTIESNQVLNESTSTDANKIDYMGYKASSIQTGMFTNGVINGWSGELRAKVNSVGTVYVTGKLVAGTITPNTHVGTIPATVRPYENTVVTLTEDLNIQVVDGFSLVIMKNGQLRVPNGSNLVEGKTYSFTVTYERAI